MYCGLSRGSSKVVVRVLWSMKYTRPSGVTSWDQLRGRGRLALEGSESVQCNTHG